MGLKSPPLHFQLLAILLIVCVVIGGIRLFVFKAAIDSEFQVDVRCSIGDQSFIFTDPHIESKSDHGIKLTTREGQQVELVGPYIIFRTPRK